MTTKKEMKTLSRDEILKLKPSTYLKRKAVEVPEWNGRVFIQELSAADQQIISQLTKGGTTGSVTDSIKMLTMVVVDEDGNRLFEEKDWKALSEHSSKVLLRLVNEASAMNKVDVKEAEKN